jgi:hypothetical protein
VHTAEPAPDDSDSAAEPGIVGPLKADRDGDGFTIASDCDDDDPTVFPGAVDVCGDGIASDCGVGPPCRYDGEWSLANAHRIVGTGTGEQAAEILRAAGDTNGDGLADFMSYSRGGAGVNLVLGPADISTFDQAEASVPGARPIAGVGDLDADGYDDVLVATRDAAWFLSGPLSGAMVPESSAFAWTISAMADGLGDWDGDGSDDVAIRWYQDSTTVMGIVPGPLSGEVSTSNATFVARGNALVVTGTGDVDADGLHDVLTSTTSVHLNGTYTGAAWLFYGGESGERDLADADALLAGVNEREHATYSIDSAGDVNADGYDDIVIGSLAQDLSWGHRVNQTAVASLVFGPVYGHLNLDEADARYECDVEPVSCSGAEVRGAGDMDGDGFDDFAVSNPVGWRDAAWGGAWLFYGPVEGHQTIDAAAAALVGDVPVNIGASAEGLGDLDGDGLDDLALGSPWWLDSDKPEEYSRGAAYIIFGGAL